MEFYPPEFLDDALSWLNSTESYQKVGFLLSCLRTLGNEELSAVYRGIQKLKRNPETLKRKWNGPREFTGRKKKKTTSEGVSKPDLSVRHPPEEVVNSEETEFDIEFNGEWWRGNAKRVMAFDVEAVPVKTGKKTKKGNDSCKPAAAKLGVVNSKCETILSKTIFHKAGSFIIDNWTKRTNGIMSPEDLEDGEDFQKVQKEFVELASKKIIITCGGAHDFDYLNLRSAEFISFDLQSFYVRSSKINPHILEPMSLRDIYFYHFEEDIQRGSHDAEVDAKATMKAFAKGYIKIWDQNINFDEVPNLKKLEEKGLLWCKMKKKFAPKCSCKECLAPPQFP